MLMGFALAYINTLFVYLSNCMYMTEYTPLKSRLKHVSTFFPTLHFTVPAFIEICLRIDLFLIVLIIIIISSSLFWKVALCITICITLNRPI